ncbi:hypothetical protein ACFFLS_04695 [Flavobacterium procerum]|uniref:Uncharacterized protein n=1 Tax=Flavobacterium procerum TaxID=1455569 RepID=A0ABV6BLM3_9FLAO
MRQLTITAITEIAMQFIDTNGNEFEMDIAQMDIPDHTTMQVGDKLFHIEHHYYDVCDPEGKMRQGFVRLNHLRKK